MKLIQTAKIRTDFRTLIESRSVQSALMTLKPGDSTGDFENEHPRSEQWLYVISGHARARVGPRRVSLKPGSLLLIERREPHQIINTGTTDLLTLNFYAPPAYTKAGDVRRSAR